MDPFEEFHQRSARALAVRLAFERLCIKREVLVQWKENQVDDSRKEEMMME